MTLPTNSNVLTGSGTYGVAGTSVTPSYSPDFPAASSVLDSDTTDSVTGTVTTQGSWNLTTAFPGTGYYTGISNAPAAGDLKRSIQVNGVTGDFPSSSSPLPNYTSNSGASTATAGSDETDLTNFITQLKSAGTFEFWDSEGVRRTGSGDTDITNANVASGVQFENLSITGSAATGSNCTGDGQTSCLTTTQYKSVDTNALTAWDIRQGKSAGGISGSIAFYKNAIDPAIYDQDGLPDNTASTAGSTNDIWDTIDDYANNGTFPSGVPASPPANWHIATGANWTDITISADTTYRDELTGLEWTDDDATTRTWSTAVSYCDGLTHNSRSDWRLPTQKELMQAYTNGIWGQKTALSLSNSNYWSSSTDSNGTSDAWRVYLCSGYTTINNKTTSYRVLCVAP